MKRTLWIVLIYALLLSTCTNQPPQSLTTKPRKTEAVLSTPPVTALPSQTATAISSPIPTNIGLPINTSALTITSRTATLYAQDFESPTLTGIENVNGTWSLETESSGNHIYCNTSSTDWQSFHFGAESWKDYLIQMRVELLALNPNGGIETYIRNNVSTQGYRATLNDGAANIADFPPYQVLANTDFPTRANHWYTYQLAAFGSHLEFSIDGQLIGDVMDTTHLSGLAGFGVPPNMQACVDDIHVWVLNEDGTIGMVPTPNPLSSLHLEVVTNNAATGDGGNAWGGHQTRIVRTADGVFTAYTTAGGGQFQRTWNLARHQDDGTWQVIAQGNAGREPVNLLASPDGTLHIIGWPNEKGTMWSGIPVGNAIPLTTEAIPNMSQSNWPYGSAGIDSAGDICVLSSVGGETPGGTFLWACYLPSKGKWATQTTYLADRYCYTYVFPNPNGGLAFVSTRDVRWAALGYSQPGGSFDYVFNALGYWRTDDVTKDSLTQLYFLEEKPTDQYPNVNLDAQQDAYIDTQGNMHVIYADQGASTQGNYVSREVILDPNGKVLKDVQLPDDIGGYTRIFQNAGGQFYLLGSSGILYPAGSDGATFGTPIPLDLQGYNVEYSGFGISAPRTGTLPGNILDVVFPSNNGQDWIYFQLALP